MALRYNRNVNINRVVQRLVRTVIALYVGGTVMTQLGTVMNGTTSSFYGGLSLIGWTVTSNQITATNGSGILVVVGIVAIAQIITEFITW